MNKSLYQIYKEIQTNQMSFTEFVEEMKKDMELIDIMEEIEIYE